MPRNPSTQPPTVAPQQQEGWINQERRYKLITPLVGGGVKPTYPDPLSLVRGSEVRGQLRFWWRACRGASNATTDAHRLADMRTREASLWGMAALADGPCESKVSIRIAIDYAGETVAWDDFRDNPEKYVLFPLDPESTSGPQHSGSTRRGIEFRLWITYPLSAAADVEAALWAWETFGGLGARTRRGAGALQCIAIDGVATTPPTLPGGVEKAIYAGLARHLRDGTWPQATPHLKAAPILKVTDAEASSEAAWRTLISKLMAYRQQRQAAPGRSLWPEPDSIRQRVKHRYGATLPATRLQLTTVAKFPRGQFGLPIVFQFYKEPVAGRYSVTLQGATEGRTRMASPLILRPVALANGKACGVAIILQQEGGYSPPGGVVLDGATADISITPDEVAQVQGETQNTYDGTLRRLNTASDPVAHFVKSYL